MNSMIMSISEIYIFTKWLMSKCQEMKMSPSFHSLYMALSQKSYVKLIHNLPKPAPQPHMLFPLPPHLNLSFYPPSAPLTILINPIYPSFPQSPIFLSIPPPYLSLFLYLPSSLYLFPTSKWSNPTSPSLKLSI